MNARQDARPPPHLRLRQPGDAADRTPAARGERLLRNPSLSNASTMRCSTRSNPRAVILSGGPASRHRRRLAQRRRRRSSSWACRSSASATASMVMILQLGGGVESGHHRGVRPGLCHAHRRRARRPDLRRPVRDRARGGLDEPRRPRHAGSPRASRSSARRRTRRSRMIADTGRGSTRVMFHPEVHHTPNGADPAAEFRAGSRGSRATGRWAPIARRRSPRSASRSGRAR